MCSAHTAMLLLHQSLHCSIPSLFNTFTVQYLHCYQAAASQPFLLVAFPHLKTLGKQHSHGLEMNQVPLAHSVSTLLPCNEKEQTKLKAGAGWERTYECIITMDVLCKLLHWSSCLSFSRQPSHCLPRLGQAAPRQLLTQKPCRIQLSVWDRISCTCLTLETFICSLLEASNYGDSPG